MLRRAVCASRIIRHDRLRPWRAARTYAESRLFPTTPTPNSPMWKHQDKLPRFPLPPLDATLDRLLEAIKPVLDDKAYAAYQVKVENFRKGVGPAIHAKLEEQEKDSKDNWMEGMWQTMYLGLRCPQLIHVSPCLIGNHDPNPLRNKSQVLKSAAQLAASARWVMKIRKQEIEAQMGGPDTPLCVYQLTQFTGASREPQSDRDQFIVHENPTHFTVMCKNQFYSVDVLHPDGSFVPESEIAKHLFAIKRHASSTHSSSEQIYPLGALSAVDRNAWAAAKAQLYGISEANQRSLKQIDSGILVLSLDDYTPNSTSELVNVALHGTPSAGNRYYDKTNIFVCGDGTMGVLLDHTAVDGITGLRYMEEVYDDVIQQPVLDEALLEKESLKVAVNYLPVETNASIRSAISKAVVEANELISQTQIVDLEFNDFGKQEIKNFKVSPDAFYQAAAHIATYRTIGKVLPTYESSSVSHFKHGRTETVRSLTSDMKDFVEKFENANVSHQDKLEAFRKAAARHAAVAKASKAGQGQDRHLQGLYWKSVELKRSLHDFQIPELFDDSYWYYMSNQLSTSNIGGNQPSVRLFGFGPVHPVGLGLGYMINDNSLAGTVSSFTGKAPAFKTHLFAALRELKALCTAK